MKNLYISKKLLRDGVTREEALDLVNFFDKECILHDKYVSASLIPIPYVSPYMDGKCSSLVLVLKDVKNVKIVLLINFYKHGNAGVGSRGNGKFQYVFHLHENGEKVVDSLPPRLRAILKRRAKGYALRAR